MKRPTPSPGSSIAAVANIAAGRGLILLSLLALMSCAADTSPHGKATELNAEELKGVQCAGAAVAKYDDIRSKARSPDATVARQSAEELTSARDKLDQDIAWLVSRGLTTRDLRQGARGAPAYAIAIREIERVRQAVALCRASTDSGASVSDETKATCRAATDCARWTPQ